MLLKKMREEVSTLKESYKKLSWIQRWFFPKKLSNALDAFKDEDIDNSSLLGVYKAFAKSYFSRTWFISSWFFSCLNLFSCVGRVYTGVPTIRGCQFLPGHTEIIMNAYQATLFDGDFAQAVFDAIVLNDGNPDWMLDVLKVLRKTALLTSTNTNALLEINQRQEFILALNFLFAKGALTGEDAQRKFAALLAVADCPQSLLELSQKEGTTQSNFNGLDTPCPEKASREEQFVTPVSSNSSSKVKTVDVKVNISSNTHGMFTSDETSVKKDAAASPQSPSFKF